MAAILHVALPALNAVAHADRHSLPGLRLGQAALHVLDSVVSNLLQSVGHRAAGAATLSSNPMTSGTATDGYARLTSKRVSKYRAGQATLVRWTARFTRGSAGNRQMAGPYNIESGYQVGYNGDTFGILYIGACFDGGTLGGSQLKIAGARLRYTACALGASSTE